MTDHNGGSGDEFVSFGDVARGQLDQQCQYASRWVGGRHGWPDLSAGLRFDGDPVDYHSLRIHRDDVAEFVARARAAQNGRC